MYLQGDIEEYNGDKRRYWEANFFNTTQAEWEEWYQMYGAPSAQEEKDNDTYGDIVDDVSVEHEEEPTEEEFQAAKQRAFGVQQKIDISSPPSKKKKNN